MAQNRLKSNWIILVLYALSFQFAVCAQQVSNLQNGVIGYWEQNADDKIALNKWEAQWIWMPDSIQSDVMLARKSFNLTDISEKALLRITASSKYKLYLNGIYICQGPARTAAHHQSFDILDIRSILKIGKNTIAVKVHHQKGKVSYHLKGRAGLLVQLDFDKGIPSIITDEEWKVLKDPSWDDNAPVINRFQQVVNDKVDLRKSIGSWNALEFDDSDWKNAKPLLRNSGWPAQKKDEKASTLTTPWISLIPRDIPYLKETNLKATQLIEAKLVKNDLQKSNVKLTGVVSKKVLKQLKGYSKKNKPVVLPPAEDGQTWFLLFDFGKVINGMPQLTIEGKKNAEINILSAPYIIDKTFTHRIVDSDFQDTLILSGNKDVWQAMYFKPARYMAIAIKGNKESVKIHYAGIHQIEYPFELKAVFSSPETPWLENLWKASIKTIDVCTTDAFTDNYRERRQYAQTGYYAALGNYWTYGDTALQRRYLIQIAQEQQPNGLMPAYAPLAKDDYMVILDSNCLWIRSLHNYLLYSGDYKTVIELLPAAQKLMTLLHSFTNAMGMIDSPPYAYWLDHTLNDRRGANLCLNGHYSGALDDYAKLLEWLELSEESEIYKKRSKLLKNSLRKHLWDADKNLFADALIDGKRSKHFSEHANGMALACNIATPEQANLIANKLLKKDHHNYIKRENGMTMVSPAMSYFLHKGLADYGFEEASFELLKNRFSKMLSSDTNKTLWEEWWLHGTGRTGKFQERTRSDAQTESVFPPDLIASYVLGLKVSEPGIKELIVSKPNVNLKHVKAKIPTPQGLFEIEWRLEKKNSLTLNVPDKMKVKLDLNSLNLKSDKTIFINEKIYNPITNVQFLILDSGIQKITF